jgi:midasin
VSTHRFDDEELHTSLALQKLTVNVGDFSSVAGADITIDDFESPLVDICGYLVAVNQNHSQQSQSENDSHQDFFPETARANLAAVALAVCKGNPILLSGPTGSGKTHTILELAKRTKNDDGLIKIHLGDQSDAKVLLGSYVCTDVPGEFRWVAGALTKAVTEGRWLVIEDIDLAPTDVLSVLIPLLQKRRLFIASRGEEIVAAPGFQLFATQTHAADGSTSSRHNAAAQLLGGFWTRVAVEPLPYDELEQVLRHSFPFLGVLAPRFIHTFKLLVTLRDGSPSEIAELVEGAASVPELSHLRVGRFVSTRDLMKWCRRVVGLIGDNATQETMHKHISSKIRELSFREATDCFAGAIRQDALRNFVSMVIARCWDLSEDRANTILHQERPQNTETASMFQIGRVALTLDPAVAAANKNGQAGPIFAYTRMSLELMEKIAQCVSHEEPVLLVGETGAGKTSTIQHLARKVGRKLVVLVRSLVAELLDFVAAFSLLPYRI